MVSLCPFLLVHPGPLSRSFTAENDFPVEVTRTRFESEKWASSFEKGATNKDVLSEIFTNGHRKRVLGSHCRIPADERGEQREMCCFICLGTNY